MDSSNYNTIESVVYLPSIDHGKFNKTDTIICQNDFDEGEKISPEKPLNCKLFRSVIRKNGSFSEKVKLRVSSIDMLGEGTQNMIRFAKNHCKLSNNARKYVDDMTYGNTIYYKGAFVSYQIGKDIKVGGKGIYLNHQLIEDAFENHSDKFSKTLTIFENAARSLLVQSILMLKKMHYKYILVDPAPGFHPKTIGKSDDEKLRGLVKLYKAMGLHEIDCPMSVDIASFAYTLNEAQKENAFDPDDPENIQNLKELVGMPDKIMPVMIGDIDEMIKRIDWRGLIGKICLLVPFLQKTSNTVKEIAQCFDALSVNSYVLKDLNKMQDESNESEFNDAVRKLTAIQLYKSPSKMTELYEKMKQMILRKDSP